MQKMRLAFCIHRVSRFPLTFISEFIHILRDFLILIRIVFAGLLLSSGVLLVLSSGVLLAGMSGSNTL